VTAGTLPETTTGDINRVSKTVSSTTTRYVYDPDRSLPVVLTDGTLKYVWGNGLAYATNTSGTVRNVYHADGLGSVRAITDATGNVSQTYQTDEFGVPSLTQGTNAQPFRFTGEQRDNESGFTYLRARYYAPALGRFPTRDTFFGATAGPLSLNRFDYVRNNPLRLTDPSGLIARPLEDSKAPRLMAPFLARGPEWLALFAALKALAGEVVDENGWPVITDVSSHLVDEMQKDQLAIEDVRDALENGLETAGTAGTWKLVGETATIVRNAQGIAVTIYRTSAEEYARLLYGG
jgi:RHS repeat-associated protein